MAQITWRVSDELAARVRAAADQHGHSVNAYLTRVLDAATDSSLERDDARRIRERLAQAGLLVRPGSARQRPDAGAFAAARKAAGRGVPLSDLVGRDRR